LKNLSRAAPESAATPCSRSGSARSAPAQKPRPAPVSSTARTEPSAASSSQHCLSSAIILRDTALSFSGALSVMVARPWSWVTTILWKVICSASGEVGGALGKEGRNSLLVVRAASQLALAIALKVELLVERIGGG